MPLWSARMRRSCFQSAGDSSARAASHSSFHTAHNPSTIGNKVPEKQGPKIFRRKHKLEGQYYMPVHRILNMRVPVARPHCGFLLFTPTRLAGQKPQYTNCNKRDCISSNTCARSTCICTRFNRACTATASSLTGSSPLLSLAFSS